MPIHNIFKLNQLIFLFVFFLNLLNLLASGFQLLIGNPAFFYNLYAKDSLGVLEKFVVLGRFSRGFGLYGSPVNYGVEILMSFSFALYLYHKSNKKGTLFLLVLVVLNAFLALSKTAIFGIPLLLCLSLFLTAISTKKLNRIVLKRTLYFTLMIAMIITFSGFIIDYLDNKGFYASYYFNIEIIMKGIETRYSENATALGETYRVISQYPFGSGFGSVRGEFIGDSDFVVLSKTAGNFGFLVYFLFIFYNFTILVRKKSYLLVVFSSFILGGLGLPNLISSNILFFFWLYYQIQLTGIRVMDLNRNRNRV